MPQFDHDAGIDAGTPTDSELLAEAGLDARAIREVLAETHGGE